jgi:hypothetical protein
MRLYEVEKDGKKYLVIKSFHYLREGIGASDLLAIDYEDNLRLRLLTATECTFLGFKESIDENLLKKEKLEKKPIVEPTALSDQ